MSKTLVFKLNIDSEEAVSNIIEIKQKLKEVADGTSLDDVNTQFRELTSIVENQTLSVGDLSKAIKAYKTLAVQAGEESPLGMEAIRRAAELKDRLEDVDKQVKTLATDGAAVNTALELSNTIVNGYQAFTGITTLLGGEQEKLVEVMAKMQIVQQSLLAVEEIRASLEKETLLSTTARAIWTKTLSGAMGLLSKTTLLSANATRVFGKALAATGIGAIVVGIGLLIANFDKVISIAKKAADALGLINLEKEEQVKQINKNIRASKREMDALEQRYDFEIEKARAAGKETYELEKEKLLAIRARILAEAQLFIEKRKLEGKLTKEEQERVLELGKKFKEVNQQLELLEINRTKTVKEESNKRIEQYKKEKEERLKNEQEVYKILEDLSIYNIRNLNERALKELEIRHKREKEELEKSLKEKGATQEQINQALANQAIKHQEERDTLLKQQSEKTNEEEINSIKDKYRRMMLNVEEGTSAYTKLELQMLEELYNKGLISELDYLEQSKRLRKQLEQQEIEERKQLDQQIIEERFAALEAQNVQEDEFGVQLLEKKKQILQELYDTGQITFETYTATLAKINDEINQKMQDQADETKKKQEAVLNTTFQFANGLMNMLMSLNKANDESTEAEKKRALSLIYIQQGIALAQALVVAGKQAKDAPPFAAAIIYATTLASQFASIHSTIKAAKESLNQAGTTPQLTAPRLSAPSIGSNSGVGSYNQGGGSDVSGSGSYSMGASGGGYGGAFKVYVLESDITQVQKFTQRVQVNSKI